MDVWHWQAPSSGRWKNNFIGCRSLNVLFFWFFPSIFFKYTSGISHWTWNPLFFFSKATVFSSCLFFEYSSLSFVFSRLMSGDSHNMPLLCLGFLLLANECNVDHYGGAVRREPIFREVLNSFDRHWKRHKEDFFFRGRCYSAPSWHQGNRLSQLFCSVPLCTCSCTKATRNHLIFFAICIRQ